MNTINPALEAGIGYSYTEYIHAYFNLLNHSMYFSTEYLDSETYQILNTLKEHFLALPELMSASAAEKEAHIHELLKIRTQLEAKYRCLSAYQQELTLLLSIKQNEPTFISEHLLDDMPPNEAIHSIDFNQLASDCTDYIFKETNGKQKQTRAALLLPYIPIKITRANYIEYVGKSIRHIAITNKVESAEYLISILNQLFDGHTLEGYGHHFEDFNTSLEQLAKQQDIHQLFEDADLLNESIENAMEQLEIMFKMLCTSSNLFILNEIDFSALTDLNAAFFDLYYSIKNILLNTDDKAVLIETLPDRLEELSTSVKKTYTDACHKEKAPLPALTLIQAQLALSIKQIFGFSTAKHSAYSEEVLAQFTEFVTQLKEKLDTLPMIERKYRMQYFISQIPFVMSQNTFNAYIRQAFTNITQPELSLYVASQLTGILEEGHFYPEPKNVPVLETSYEEDDEAAAFIAKHADLFNESLDKDPFAYFETPNGDLSKE